MSLNLPTFLALIGYVALLLWLSRLYFDRKTLPRPPIGVYKWSDIVFMSAVLILAPLGYLAMPAAAVASLFGLILLTADQIALSPFLGGRRATVAATLLCAATVLGWLLHQRGLTVILSDLVLTLGAIGVVNLWVQGGMRAGHIAGLGVLLTGYDLVATSLTTVTARFAAHVEGLPFAPLVLFSESRPPVEIGLGDLLMILAFPLAAAKAFGRRAGLVAAYVGAATLTVVALLAWAREIPADAPLLTALGPLILIQYAYWRRRGYRERTVREWRADAAPAGPAAQPSAEPSVGDGTDARTDALAAALLVRPPAEDLAADAWVAIVDGDVAGVGASPGAARRAAREAGHAGVPVVRQFWV